MVLFKNNVASSGIIHIFVELLCYVIIVVMVFYNKIKNLFQ